MHLVLDWMDAGETDKMWFLSLRTQWGIQKIRLQIDKFHHSHARTTGAEKGLLTQTFGEGMKEDVLSERSFL